MWLEMCSRRSLLRVRSEPRPQGWLGEQCLLTLILLNLLGHTRVADVAHPEADPGLCELVRCYEPRLYGLCRGRMEKRFRGQRKRTFPSDRSLLDWLSRPQHRERLQACINTVHRRLLQELAGNQGGRG